VLITLLLLAGVVVEAIVPQVAVLAGLEQGLVYQ
jgi:hypothetical protein